MELELTKDSQKVLGIMYKTYLERIKNGSSKFSAIEFNESSIIQKQLFPDMSVADLDYCLIELYQNNLISMDIIGGSQLLPKSINYFENKNIKTIENVLDFISKFIP